MDNRNSENNAENYGTPLKQRRDEAMTRSQFLRDSVRPSINPEDIVRTFFKDSPVPPHLSSSKNTKWTWPATAQFPTNPPASRSSIGTTWSSMKKCHTANPSALTSSKELGAKASSWNPKWWSTVKEKPKIGPDCPSRSDKIRPELPAGAAQVAEPVAGTAGRTKSCWSRNTNDPIMNIYSFQLVHPKWVSKTKAQKSSTTKIWRTS